MSAPEFERVLGEHIAFGGEDDFDVCGCGWAPSTDEPFAEHRAHLAAALNAEVARWLADEGTQEQVADALEHPHWCESNFTSGCNCGDWRSDEARDALAALTPTDTTADEKGTGR